MSRPHPAIDLVTDAAAIVLQKRPLVPLTSWINDAISAASDAGMPLQIVTPHTARLTMPLYSLLQPPFLRWVVGHPDGFYDGVTGELLQFDGSGFVSLNGDERQLAEAYVNTPEAVDGVRLMLSFRVRHPPADDVLLGAATEMCYRELGGVDPCGWGTSEPIAQAWDPENFTRLCRNRAPQGTFFCHTGLGGSIPAIGTTWVRRHIEGVDEEVTLHLGYRSEGELPIGKLADVVEEIAAAHHLVDLYAQANPGQRDLTTVPHWTGPPAPIGMAIGSEVVQENGRERAFGVPDVTAQPIGDAERPGAWYPLGDGRTTEAWPLLERLMSHLKQADSGYYPGSGLSKSQTPLREGVWRRRPE